MGLGLLPLSGHFPVITIPTQSLSLEHSHPYWPPQMLWSVPPIQAQGKADATCVDAHPG